MARSLVFKRTSSAEVGFNMTPMIDCTFQLIIFFILASQVASSELAMLFLPKPHESQALPEKAFRPRNRVIVNVLSKGGSKDRSLKSEAGSEALRYEISGMRIPLEDMDRLTEIIRKRKEAAAEGEDFYVEVRADLRVDYGYVEPVLLAAAEAGVRRMNLSALLATGEAGQAAE